MFHGLRNQFCSVLLLALACAAPSAWAIQVGINIDVHQDIRVNLGPNDYHMQGLIESKGGDPPRLLTHVDGPFTAFDYTLKPNDPNDPGGPWYWFECTWKMEGAIKYCTVVHMGLLFDVNASNVIFNLVGWWTRDGRPMGTMKSGLVNQGYIAMPGFSVDDKGLVATLGNGIVPNVPPLTPPPGNTPPWPPAPINLNIVQADVIVFPPGEPPDFRELNANGDQQNWKWTPVTYADGAPISPNKPVRLQSGTTVDIGLGKVPGSGTADSLVVKPELPLEPGGYLVLRQKGGFINNAGVYEERWFWEIHGAPVLPPSPK